MVAGDTRQMALILKQFKHKNGEVNYPAIFNVPSTERLPAMFQRDFMQATGLVVAALTMAFEKMSFKRKMDGATINNIAEEILDTCDEDNLSLEDLVLFLQNMVRGKYGNMEEISIARFMGTFDKYRDERHYALIDLRENEHLQYKGLGDASRSAQSDPLADHFSSFGERIHELKDALQYEKNIHLKDIDKF